MSKPRPGYKVIKPPYPPHFSGSIPTAATGILHHTTGTAISSHAYPLQPPLTSVGMCHPTGGGPLPPYQGYTGVSVSVQFYSVFSQHTYGMLVQQAFSTERSLMWEIGRIQKLQCGYRHCPNHALLSFRQFCSGRIQCNLDYPDPLSTGLIMTYRINEIVRITEVPTFLA